LKNSLVTGRLDSISIMYVIVILNQRYSAVDWFCSVVVYCRVRTSKQRGA